MKHILALTAATFASPTPAYAAVVLGIDNHFSHTLPRAPDIGTGVGASLGLGAELALFEVRPEVGVSWYSPSQRLLPRVGARLMLGKVVEPGIYAHVVFANGLSLAPGRGGYDAGIALDLTAVPTFDIGLHTGLLGLPGEQGNMVHLWQSGLHLALHF